ncbi:MAG: shikimate kinase [Planctomycetota bacterium]|nr:shikimate kinase [Planctomycetota bacterium]
MSEPSSNLVLMGLRGSGKSTIARMLAKRTARISVDLDFFSPQFLNAESPADALTRFGEAAFRDAELKALEKTLARFRIVLALGGGTPTHAPSREKLVAAQREGRAYVVYLRASASTLRDRLISTDLSSRPALLGGDDPLGEIEALLEKRDALYLALADETVECDGLDAEQVVERVLEVWRAGGS